MGRRPDPNLEAARKRLREAEKRAQQKMREMNKQNRVNIQGSKYDPTKGADIGRLNAIQVKARLARVEKFNDPNTQYYGDAVGRVISPRIVSQYKSAVAKVSAEAKANYEPFKNIRMPGNKESVNTFHKKRRERHTNVRKSAVRDVSNPFFFKMHAFGNEKKLAEYVKWLNQQVGRISKKDLKAARRQFKGMARAMGDKETEKRVNELSDNQFKLLWFHSSFVENYKAKYVVATDTGKEDKRTEIETDSTDELIGWAGRKFKRK